VVAKDTYNVLDASIANSPIAGLYLQGTMTTTCGVRSGFNPYIW